MTTIVEDAQETEHARIVRCIRPEGRSGPQLFGQDAKKTPTQLRTDAGVQAVDPLLPAARVSHLYVLCLQRRLLWIIGMHAL